MKKFISLLMTLALVLSLNTGFCFAASAASDAASGELSNGGNDHKYTSPAYTYTEEACFSGLTCVIPEFDIAQSGAITLNFSGTSITATYTASRFNYTTSTGTSNNVSNGNLPGLNSGSIGTSVSQGSGATSSGKNGYGWDIEIKAGPSSIKTKAPSPYNNLNSFTVKIVCEVLDTDTFPKKTFNVVGVGMLTTSNYPCTFNSRTVDYSLNCEFEEDWYETSSENMTIKLRATSRSTGNITLAPKQQSMTNSSVATYYGSSGINVEALRYSEPTGDLITVKCSERFDIEEKPATCTNAGYKIKSCECGYYEKEELAATGHSWKLNSVVEPTCTKQGYTVHICDECGYSGTSEYKDALGHNYAATIITPTCTDEGYTTYTCTNCGDSYQDNYVKAKDHSYALISETIASCEKDGVRTYACECGDAYTEHETALGHNYEGGLCSACGKEDPNADVEKEFAPGDVNGDGRVNFSDYSKTLHCAKNPGALDESSDEFKRMDINGDGRINFSDYAQVLALAKGV